MTLSDAIQVIRAPFAVYAHEGDGFMGSWDFVHVSDTGTISTGTLRKLLSWVEQKNQVQLIAQNSLYGCLEIKVKVEHI